MGNDLYTNMGSVEIQERAIEREYFSTVCYSCNDKWLKTINCLSDCGVFRLRKAWRFFHLTRAVIFITCQNVIRW